MSYWDKGCAFSQDVLHCAAYRIAFSGWYSPLSKYKWIRCVWPMLSPDCVCSFLNLLKLFHRFPRIDLIICIIVQTFLVYKLESPVGWGCWIHWQHLCRRIRQLLTSLLDMTLKHQMLKLEFSSFGECGEPLHWHYSLVHSNLDL